VISLLPANVTLKRLGADNEKFPYPYNMINVLIPAYQPNNTLTGLVCALLAASQDIYITIVDDGSTDAESIKLLNDLRQKQSVHVIRHHENLGKGAALKTGIKYLKSLGVIQLTTADADGQHHVTDILAVSRAAVNSDKLHIGARRFSGAIPLRSRFGNLITRWIFNRMVRNGLEDTQSGLRVIPARHFDRLLTIEWNRYEFEFEALITIANEEDVIEVQIETIYEPGNPTSHFRPLIDSVRIYYVLLRYLLIVGGIAGIDFLCFLALSQIIDPATAFICTRVATIGLYIYAVRALVFRERGYRARQICAMLGLIFINMILSFWIIREMATISFLPTSAGWFTSAALLVSFNFIIQRTLIFSTRDERKEPSATDWTSYYNLRAPLGGLTRRITANLVRNTLMRVLPTRPLSICELGGGASCVMNTLTSEFSVTDYHVVDTNALGLSLLQGQNMATTNITSSQDDVTVPYLGTERYDAVLSIGLIEHFDLARTAAALRGHFERVKPGGVVLVTYPTPTLLYHLIRGAAEIVGAWRFHDERPLCFEEISNATPARWTIAVRRINWWIGLTQEVLVFVERDFLEGSNE